MLRYLVLLGAVAAVCAITTPVSTCNNNARLPINTYVSGANGGCHQPPCVFPQLTDVNVEIIFTPENIHRRMRVRALAYLGVVLPIPFPMGEQTNACLGLTNTKCPLTPGEVIIYSLRMHIELFMAAGTSVNVEFSLMDDDTNAVLVCVRVPLHIIEPLGTRANTTAGAH